MLGSARRWMPVKPKSRDQSMIRKSGNRFSEKIMLEQKARAGCQSNHNSSRSRRFAIRRLWIELGVPVEIVEPAIVQIIGREEPSVAVQVLHRRLKRPLRRPHLRLVGRQIALPQIAR